MEHKKDKTIEIKSNQVLTNYMKELQDDVRLSTYNLREKSLMCSSLWAKWISYLYLEKDNLQRIADMKQKILKTQMQNNKVQDSVLRLKSEEKLTETNENLKKLNILSKQTQDNIDFIEHALNIFQQFGYNIKNVYEILKLNLTQ